MNKILDGVVHGRTIELLEDPGVGDGEKVRIVLSVPASAESCGEGIRRTAGALADDPHWDAIMAEVHHARKRQRRQPPDEP